MSCGLVNGSNPTHRCRNFLVSVEGADLQAIATWAREDPIRVHVSRRIRVNSRERGVRRIDHDLCWAAEGARLEECDTGVLRRFEHADFIVDSLGEERIVNPFRAYSGPDDVRVLGFRQHIAGFTNRAENVIAWVCQALRACKAGVDTDLPGHRVD